MTENLREWFPIRGKYLRVLFFWMPDWRCHASVWRESEASNMIVTATHIISRHGPPYRWCIRIRIGKLSMHIGLGRYRSAV